MNTDEQRELLQGMRETLEDLGFDLRFPDDHRESLAALLSDVGYVAGLELQVNSWLAFATRAATAKQPRGKPRLKANLEAIRKALGDLETALDSDSVAREALGEHLAARGVFGAHAVDPAAPWHLSLTDFMESVTVDGDLPHERMLRGMRVSLDALLALEWGGRQDESLRDQLVLAVVSQIQGCGIPLVTSRSDGGKPSPAELVLEAALRLAKQRAPWLSIPKRMADLLADARKALPDT